ncbi:MAG: AraC family transcriptional regulator [Desulfobacteraceae bacterium]|nr:MAG: AraC family transcriptional regulator [Desulfobacteraceae bacterium]
MQTFHNIASLIILLAAFLAFFSSLIFLRIKNGNVKANRFLSLFCFSTAVYLTRGSLLLNGILIRSPLLNEFMDNTRFFLGPALYLYIKTVVDPDSRLRWTDAVHLAPVMLNLIVRSPFYFSHDDYQIHYLARWLNGPLTPQKSPLNYLSQSIFFGSFWFYIGHAVRFHWKSKEAILKSSRFGPFYLSWLRIFTYALTLAMAPWLIGIVVVFSGYSLRYPFYTMNLTISLMVFFCVIKILSWPEILFMAKPLKSRKKYNASYLDNREADRFLDKIKCLMEQEQAYLDPDLDLSALAAKLSIPKNYLSQVINEKTGKSFNDFINHYRIESVKTRLRDRAGTDKTLLALAFDAGFNSKASFNNAFKKSTGESPLIFKKRCADLKAKSLEN